MKIFFKKANFEDFFKFIKKKQILNFINLYGVYWFNKSPIFRESISNENTYNFIDSFFVSFFLSIKKLKKIPRLTGPIFTRNFLNSEKSKNEKIMFIGTTFDEKDISFLCSSFNLKKRNVYFYNKLPYIAPKLEYSKEDIKKVVNFIKKIKPSFVFVCVGNPRQEILSYELSKYYKKATFISIGAAMDFLLGKKKEAPSFVRKIGMEWFYRLVTDFKYSKIKVWRSFIAVFYLLFGKVRIDLKD